MEHGDDMKRNEACLTPFGKWVNGRIHLLTTGGRYDSGIRREGYLQNDSYATASIARLRHAVGHDIGADPDIFEWTMPIDGEVIGINPSRYDSGATAQEMAAHAALTLFAVHQQSVHESSMHTDDNVSMGGAVGHMAYGNFNESGIRSMFNKLQMANSWKELIRYARGLISLLKRERVALNYGVLAQDLYALRSGRNAANKVRTRWGRDFQRSYWSAKNEQEKTASETNN